MLEKPFLTVQAFSTKENLFQLALRCRHAFMRHENPRNRLTLSKKQYDSYFKFSVVRNPWVRAFSWYSNCMHDSRHLKRLGLDAPVSFNKFLRMQAGRGALRPQTSWVRNFRGQIDMDYIARFESIESDFPDICQRIGMPSVPLPHARRGAGEDYRLHFDEETIQLIANVYAEEIELFAYSFEN